MAERTGARFLKACWGRLRERTGWVQGMSLHRFLGPIVVAALSLSIAGCQGTGEPSSTRGISERTVEALQRVNEAGAKCWTGTAQFQDLRLIPELDTVVGRPRLLLLEKDKTRGLPVMVIEASGPPVKIETYGPLTDTPTGERINADIRRWSIGPQTCQG